MGFWGLGLWGVRVSGFGTESARSGKRKLGRSRSPQDGIVIQAILEFAAGVVKFKV